MSNCTDSTASAGRTAPGTALSTVAAAATATTGPIAVANAITAAAERRNERPKMSAPCRMENRTILSTLYHFSGYCRCWKPERKQGIRRDQTGRLSNADNADCLMV